MSLFKPQSLYNRFKRGGAVLLLAALLSFNVGAFRTTYVSWYPDLFVLIDDTLYQIEDYSGLVMGYPPADDGSAHTTMYNCPKYVYLNGINYTLDVEKGFGLIGDGDQYQRIIYEPLTIYGDYVEIYSDHGDGTVDIRCYGFPGNYPLGSGVDLGPWLLWYTSSNPATELSGVGLYIAAEKSSADEIAEIMKTDPDTSGMSNKLTEIGQLSGDLDEIGSGVVFDPSEEADLIEGHISDIEQSAYRIGTGLQAFFTNQWIAVCVAAAALTLVFLAILRKAGD